MALPEARSYYEKLKEFDSVPLFMRSLPEEGVDDVAITALQSLAHEGTPDEIAQNFKEKGNDYFKGKRYREASSFYSQGIDAKPTDLALLDALLCNRAACNLELQNYGSVLRDCSKAIALNSHSSKAFYRSALALLALDRLDDALDACERCLIFDANNTVVKALRERAYKAKIVKDEKETKRIDAVRRQQEERARIREAFKERGLIDVPHPSGSSDNEYSPHFDEEGSLILPTLFLYPQYAQSDLVPKLYEDTTFGDQLAGMFPPSVPAPEWDAKCEYTAGKLSLYAISHSKRLLKVGMRMTLRDVMNAARASKDGKLDGLEVRDGCVSIVVVPKGDVEQGWVQEFKSSRDRAE